MVRFDLFLRQNEAQQAAGTAQMLYSGRPERMGEANFVESH